MAHPLCGLWTNESSTNYDAILKELGINFMLRKAANLVVPDIEIKNKGDRWTIAGKSSIKSMEMEFIDGVEFEEETPDGRNVKSTYRVEGNRIIMEQRDSSNKTPTVFGTREVNQDGKLVETIECNNAKAVRIYSRKK